MLGKMGSLDVSWRWGLGRCCVRASRRQLSLFLSFSLCLYVSLSLSLSLSLSVSHSLSLLFCETRLEPVTSLMCVLAMHARIRTHPCSCSRQGLKQQAKMLSAKISKVRVSMRKNKSNAQRRGSVGWLCLSVDEMRRRRRLWSEEARAGMAERDRF